MQRLYAYFRNATKLFVAVSLLTFSFQASAQQKTVTGTVKDESGEPLSKISVAIAGTKTGTTTDGLGKFKISASVGDELVFTSATHEMFRVKVDDRSDYLVAMKPNSSSLNDVVVVGYGRQKKSTSSVPFPRLR